MIVFIIFGSNEDTYNNVFSLVADNIDLVGERLVGESFLASNNLEVVLVEFIFADIQGIGDFKFKFVEVSVQLVDAYAFNLDTWVVQLSVGVMRKMALVLEEIVCDPLVELVEDWVAKSGFEVFQSAWNDLVFIDWVSRIT